MGNVISLHGKIYSQENGYPASFEACVAETFSVFKDIKGYDIFTIIIFIYKLLFIIVYSYLNLMSIFIF